MPEWQITCNINDSVAITVGRTVLAEGDTATDDECRRAFAAALPQFMARAVAARYSAALDARAQVRSNDLASAVVASYPDGYDPQIDPVQLREPAGPTVDFIRGPVADPSTITSSPPPPPIVDPIPNLAAGGATG